MRQTGSRGLLSADTSRWDDRALPLLLNTLIIKWSPEGKKIDEGTDTERTTLTGPGGGERKGLLPSGREGGRCLDQLLKRHHRKLHFPFIFMHHIYIFRPFPLTCH